MKTQENSLGYCCEIKDLVKKQKSFPQLNAFFDQYVTVIEQDSSNLIRKSGEASGGSFQIHIKEAFTQFCWETVEQCVLEKFDSKAARIFRLLDQVVRMVLELCYKTLYNIMTRRNHERDANRRIIDKKQRVDTIAMGMRAQGALEEQLADIEEMITPPERQILENIDRIMKKLNSAELEIDETIFLLQIYLMYE
ncbi:hypothetical protein NQ317_011198 [Molorchus minor]|uniref:DNA-directed RNA polymerase III subunit RPC3 n=1 Tax=Molorchus minor TaxID=1323400 RepID=A0ABQ9JRK2_9CUCU|nr:hypothetical protein NQ317_011198 [Molorchus minor]